MKNETLPYSEGRRGGDGKVSFNQLEIHLSEYDYKQEGEDEVKKQPSHPQDTNSNLTK